VDYIEEAIRQLVENRNAPDCFIPFNYSSNAAEKQCLVSSGPSYLFGFTVSNANAAARFVLLFDTNTAPANGAVPKASFQVATVASVGVAYWPPRRMDEGIFLCASSTQNTLTLVAASEHLFDVQYV
jgi:hypothetical protein